MKRRIAVRLRAIAQRLDPPPTARVTITNNSVTDFAAQGIRLYPSASNAVRR